MTTLAGTLIRWLLFSATVVAVGAVAFRTLVLPALSSERDAVADAARRRAARIGAAAALLVLPLALARLGVQVAEMREPGESWTEPAATMLTGTTWGIGWMVQAAGALAAAAALVVAGASRGGRAAWALAAAGAAALALAPALSGHAAGSPSLTTAAIVADALHVAGAGTWLGTLAVLVAAGLPACRAAGTADEPALVAALVRRFSPLALASAAVVVLSGVFASWLHVDRPASLWRTTYGLLLLAKIALAAGVALVGAWNWRRLTPTLAASGEPAVLRRSALLELAVGTLLLLATAVLVATPLPGEE